MSIIQLIIKIIKKIDYFYNNKNNLSKLLAKKMVIEIGLLMVLIAPPVFISFRSIKSISKRKSKNKFKRIDKKYEFPEQLRI